MAVAHVLERVALPPLLCVEAETWQKMRLELNSRLAYVTKDEQFKERWIAERLPMALSTLDGVSAAGQKRPVRRPLRAAADQPPVRPGRPALRGGAARAG